jgi:hypothetical protein
MAAPLDLTSEVVASMAPGRFFRDTAAAINSLDFHRTEDWLVCAGARARRAGGAQLLRGAAARRCCCAGQHAMCPEGTAAVR